MENSLLARIRSLLKLGSVTEPLKFLNDIGDYPIQKVTYLGKLAESIMWHGYGEHANLPKDTLVILTSMQANSEARIGLPDSGPDRPRGLKEGEKVVFHPPTGAEIRFKEDGAIELTTAGSSTFVIKTQTADIDVVDDITIDAGGDATITVIGDITLNALADVDITAIADVNVTTVLGTVSVDALDVQLGAGTTQRLMNEAALAVFNAHVHTGAGTNPPTIPMVVGTATTAVTKAS